MPAMLSVDSTDQEKTNIMEIQDSCAAGWQQLPN